VPAPAVPAPIADVVAAALREAAPEVREIVPVFDIDEDLIRQALAILRKGRDSQNA